MWNVVRDGDYRTIKKPGEKAAEMRIKKKWTVVSGYETYSGTL
jgi:hypothetical protein